MENHGWRAIIYDADWARFKSGQTGVFVSDDGKTCETVDDDKSNIIVETDPNMSFTPRKNGHILFKQKGTELFDIVCLLQESGGIYELEASNVTIDGCNGLSYDNFIKSIEVYEIINKTNRRKIGYDEKKQIIKSPTDNDFARNNNYIGYDNDESGPVIVNIEKSGATTTSEIIVKAKDEPYDEYSGTTFKNESGITIMSDDDKNFYITLVLDNANGCTGGDIAYVKKNVGEVSCTIFPKSGNVAGNCGGGDVTFDVEEIQISNPVYTITVDVDVYDIFRVIQCGEEIDTKEIKVENYTVSVTEKDGIVVKQEYSHDSKTIKIEAVNGVNTVEIVVETERGVKLIKELNIPN